jgi:orotate phosphoribosyltransferase
MNAELGSLLHRRSGHFLYESGHHGDLWLDLETLCQSPAALRPFVVELASRLASYKPEVVCGPLVEGAFVALLVAGELGCEFTYANRFAATEHHRLYPVQYRLPATLGPVVKGRRVAIVNDVVSAGSAVRRTYEDLTSLGARVSAVGCLLVLGDAFPRFAEEHGLELETLERAPHRLWAPEECPLCAQGAELEKLAVA